MAQIERAGQTIAFEDIGTGTPVVLGHSFLCSGAMWSEQLPELTSRHRVINVDIRGHGQSGPVRSPCTLHDLVDDVLAVLDDRGIENAVWAGLSLGGFVALRAALRAPDRVTGLILVGTDGGAENVWRRCKYAALAAIARRVGIGPVRPQVTKQMFGATTRKTNPDLVRYWSDRFAEADVPSMLHVLDSFTDRDDLLPRLNDLATPALVIVGHEDASLPPERSRRLAAALPNARLIEVPRAGHLAALEQPAAVTGAMLDFLTTLPGETTGAS